MPKIKVAPINNEAVPTENLRIEYLFLRYFSVNLEFSIYCMYPPLIK